MKGISKILNFNTPPQAGAYMTYAPSLLQQIKSHHQVIINGKRMHH